ncbi:NUDIX hydrolase [Seonamhaeicola sp.]|uniref:NUDIX hydrolase n=1 Tax=Seonamhaeicola sp. TaxID=1912245 RepID=UPI0026257AA0|nr:NUDIX hydrolase [Seonamhaeicola sp.]
MILKNSKGDIFQDFIEVEETDVSKFSPLTHSLAVAEHKGNYLLVFNRFKKHWELPGGLIDKGESPRQCAIRETKEESNQELSEVRFLGIMTFDFQPDHRVKERRMEFGTLYFGNIKKILDFEKNSETSKLCFWDGKADIGTIGPFDAKLIELVKEKINAL